MGRFDSYSGLLSAFPYAFGQSDSRLFKSYALVSTFVGALVAVFVALSLVVLIGNTASAQGGTLTLSRTFYVLVGLAVFFPLVAPVLLVARRHRRDMPVDSRYDPALATAGYAFVLSVYVGLVISTPSEHRESISGVVGIVVNYVYSLPAVVGFLPPTIAALAIYAVHRRLG